MRWGGRRWRLNTRRISVFSPEADLAIRRLWRSNNLKRQLRRTFKLSRPGLGGQVDGHGRHVPEFARACPRATRHPSRACAIARC